MAPISLPRFLPLLLCGGLALQAGAPGAWEIHVARDDVHFRVGDDDKFVATGFVLEGRLLAAGLGRGELWATASHRFSSFRVVSEDDEDHDNPEDTGGLAAFRLRSEYSALGLRYRGPARWGLAPSLGLEGRWTRTELVSRSGDRTCLQEPLLMLRAGLDLHFPHRGFLLGLEGGIPLHRFRSSKWATLGTTDDAGAPQAATFTAPATAWELRIEAGLRF